MSNRIRKFFSRKKEEAKFKLKVGNIGTGHQLNAPSAPSSSNRQPPKDVYIPPKRQELSNEAKAAAAAALARVEKKDNKEFNTSLAAIKAQAKRELEAERKLKEEAAAGAAGGGAAEAAKEVVENKNLACHGVFFRCPMIGEEILPKKEWKIKIKEFLYQQLEQERALTACLIIYNCNTKEKAEDCVATLSKYIENLINHPDEEKYCKIRMTNRIFCEKVRYVEGALDFLNGAGFREQEIDNEPFLLWCKDNLDPDMELPVLLDALQNAEPILLELDRNIQVLLPMQAKRTELPMDFFRITPEEIKREQQLRSEAIESAQILKTKAMREREEQRNLRMYRFALIRIKFPNGIYLQGTFNVYEKLGDIYQFVQSCLADEALEFNLTLSGSQFSDQDMDKSLYDLRLIPSVMFLFIASTTNVSDENFLKEDLLMLIQPM
ncbi:UBX domain-containing protein 6 [Episyrphus balteatus]|uniref:UBX domain-containing protein 6 n=1 Tax=Episyrphus balteatus TaxID=286459 RepID=UPI00248500FD|nr:UBX domain-containing protein 6 [Episyrphus balteatus]